VIDLIFCGGGNRRFMEIATAAGFRYGARLPDTIYGPLYFADQDWRRPDRAAYMAALAQHRPHMASVLDLERADQLGEVLSWAEDAAQFVDVVMLIPKVFGIIPRIPRRVGSADVRLGYSVPTKHGGTDLPVWEFAGWPVHLLGGSPHAQRRLAHYLSVASADGNMMMKMANHYGAFYDPAKRMRRGYWPTLADYDGQAWGDGGKDADAPYEAFRRSCENIMWAWQRIGG
jgi:hypothetical protein